MEVGLLWYDSDPKRGLEDKIGQAAQRYREKYGRWPNTCYVHPQIVDGGGNHQVHVANRSRDEIRVLPAPNVLLHHFWLGVATNGDAAEQRKSAVN
jgi:hypothetical protein